MTPRSAISRSEQTKNGDESSTNSSSSNQSSSSNWIKYYDALAEVEVITPFARWSNRTLIFFLCIFSISVPHSVAAAHISLNLCLIAWIARDLSLRRFHFARTRIDLPLICFASLTIISSVFSVEPGISLPKLKALLLFGVTYIIATNLRPRGIYVVLGLLLLSSSVGAGFSLMEKIMGRGMVITAIEAGSPLAGTNLVPGDVIWMIGKKRVYTPDDAARVIRRQRSGKVLEVEGLREGGPIPVPLRVTDELKARANPLGISIGGRSRQFRISGFSRQFQTYAEQMQILALLTYGGLLTCFRVWRRRQPTIWLKISCLLFLLFSTALILTATRAVIASFIIAVFFVSIISGSRLASILALLIALPLGGLGLYVITKTREQTAIRFNDDSTARRLSYMQAGLRVIPKHPLTGVGMDSVKLHWKEWGFPGEYITHTHSTPIQIAMDRGLPALASYIWLMAAIILVLWRGYRIAIGDEFSQSLMLGALGALIGFSVSSLTNYNFGDSEVLMLLLLILSLVILKTRVGADAHER
jgi:O-antigen ligase/polysaccharide polymerase Wzy-like membrane protein